MWTSISTGQADIPFETSFRLVCGQLLEYWHKQESLPPKFYNCPNWCGDKQKKLPDHCQACPVQVADKEFRAETIQLLDKRIGDEWKQYDFDSLVNTVYQVSSIAEKDDSDWTVQTARLVGIFQGEQAKRQRTVNFNSNQASKNQRK